MLLCGMDLVPLQNWEVGRINLHALQTFVVAARLENFRATADRLCLSQPTVSAQMRELEAELGEPLFDRSGRRVRLNAAGQSFLCHSEEILRAMDTAVAALPARRGTRKGFVIATSPEPARTLVPQVVHSLLSQHPAAEISLQVVAAERVQRMVADGQIDAGITQVAADPALQRVNCQELSREKTLLVARSRQGDPQSADWHQLLRTERLISHGNPGHLEKILKSLAGAGMEPRVLPVGDAELAKRLAIRGVGVTFLSETLARHALNSGLLGTVPTADLKLPTSSTYLLLPAEASSDFLHHFLATVGRVLGISLQTAP